jgi:hypothetical protein
MNEYEDLKDYEGLYKINREGDIFSVRKNKILKQRVGNRGYKMVGLYKNKQEKLYLIHRLLCIQFLENTENKSCVDHIDRNRQNNCLDNLRWATHSENMRNVGVKGCIYITKNNTFQTKFYYEPNKRMSKSFKTKEEAEAWLEQIKIEYPR